MLFYHLVLISGFFKCYILLDIILILGDETDKDQTTIIISAEMMNSDINQSKETADLVITNGDGKGKSIKETTLYQYIAGYFNVLFFLWVWIELYKIVIEVVYSTIQRTQRCDGNIF